LPSPATISWRQFVFADSPGALAPGTAFTWFSSRPPGLFSAAAAAIKNIRAAAAVKVPRRIDTELRIADKRVLFIDRFCRGQARFGLELPVREAPFQPVVADEAPLKVAFEARPAVGWRVEASALLKPGNSLSDSRWLDFARRRLVSLFRTEL
jgi:hypothetical protein